MAPSPHRPRPRAPTRAAKGKRARGAARSRRERSVPARPLPGGYSVATRRGRRARDLARSEHVGMLSRLDGAPVRPPVSRYAAPAWSLFADLLPLRGDRSAFGHSMRPLNVSECRYAGSGSGGSAAAPSAAMSTGRRWNGCWITTRCPDHSFPAALSPRSESVRRRAGCGSPARPDLWGPRAGDRPGLPDVRQEEGEPKAWVRRKR